MRDRDSTRPFVFFFLVLPYGISSGFVSITLPFVLTRVGFFGGAGSVDRGHRRVGKSLAISLGTGGGPDFDRAPLVFVGTWHICGDVVASCASAAPSKRLAVLMIVVFVSQVAGTLIVLPVGGLMVHRVAEGAKGRAAGWYQAGNLGGNGIGGGVGVWLASHFSKEIA